MRRLGPIALAIALAGPPLPLGAKVVGIDVESVAPATAVEGAAPYEVLSGSYFGELDPADPRNRIVTDIAFAPRNARGMVEYRATFRIARPVDPARASGVLFYDVPNRGMGAVAADPDGHVRAISGWQGDIPPRPYLQTASVPAASGKRGPVISRYFKVPATARSVAIGGGYLMPAPRPLPLSLDTAKASLWRESRDGARMKLSPGDWAFADCGASPFPGKPDPAKLCLKAGFDPDAAYTLVYQGKDPPVLGIGFAAMRDFVAFLGSGKPDALGRPNPAGGAIRWTVGAGNSQSGNFLRSFVHLGFNADENGARVFDGINANIAARQVPLNLRLGVPGGAAGTYEPGSEGTLWWGLYNDRARKLGRSSLLARCTRDSTCPKVVETLGSAEFWGLRASPGFVGTDARTDIPLPANVRRYYIPSVTHGGGRSIGFPAKLPPRPASCMLPANPNPSTDTMRVALRALVDWVRLDKQPPPSRYPLLAKGDLVAPTAKALPWPAIPGAPSPDGKINAFVEQDFGPGLRANDLSGFMTRQPPRVRRVFPSLVPRLDADGNETSGIRSVQLQVPLGTYTGWNVETKGIGAGGGCGFEGGFIPFARTKAEREASGDPRPSLEERYGDHAGFVAKIREAVARQQADGWLLPEDAARIVREAEASDVLR